MFPDRGAAALLDAICNAQGCRELTRFSLYLYKCIFKMSSNANRSAVGSPLGVANYISFAGCHIPKKVGKHWFIVNNQSKFSESC